MEFDCLGKWRWQANLLRGPPSLTCYINTAVIYQGVFFVCLFSVRDITVVI